MMNELLQKRLIPEPHRLAGARLCSLMEAGKRERSRGCHLAALVTFRAAEKASPSNAAVATEVGESLRLLKRLEEAKFHLLEVRTKHPRFFPVLTALGRCASDDGDQTAALECFALAVVVGSSASGAIQELAEAQLQAGRLDEATQTYQAMLERVPTSVISMAGLATCARRRGDHPAALAHSRAACLAVPNNVSLRVSLADDLRELDILDEASTNLQAALAIEPGNFVATLAAARLAHKMGHPARAIELAERARAGRPNDARAVLTSVSIHRDFGDIVLARELATQLLRLMPRHVQGHVELGLLEREVGNHQAAFCAFQAAYHIEPARTGILLNMVRECYILGDRDRGDAYLKDALGQDRSGVQARLLATQRAIMMEDYEAALAIAKAGLAEGRTHVSLYLAAADAQARLGRTSDAADMLDAAQGLAGNRSAVTLRRLNLLRQNGLWAEAVDLARNSFNSTKAFCLGLEFLRLSIFGGSQADISKCLEDLSPATRLERSQLLALKGIALEDNGNLEAAITHYRDAIKEQPERAEPYRLLTRAHILQFDFPSATLSLRQHAVLVASANLLRHRSTKPSQTHLGQILNECLLDQDAVLAVSSLRHIAPASRIKLLSDLTIGSPDNTLIALALVDALWRADLLKRRQTPARCKSADCPIPKKIIQFWDEINPPMDIRSLMDTWRNQNPDYAYVAFDDESAQNYLTEKHPPEVLQAYRRAAEPAKKADLFRLAYLSLDGGVYADADDRSRGSLDQLLSPGAELILYREELGTVGNNFMACVSGNAVIRAALDQVVTAINRGDDELLWLSTGPGLITRALAQQASLAADVDAFLANITVWHRRDVFQSIDMHCYTTHKQTKSHWGNRSFQRSISNVRRMTVFADLGPVATPPLSNPMGAMLREVSASVRALSHRRDSIGIPKSAGG